jgi:hypothetical protein
MKRIRTVVCGVLVVVALTCWLHAQTSNCPKCESIPEQVIEEGVSKWVYSPNLLDCEGTGSELECLLNYYATSIVVQVFDWDPSIGAWVHVNQFSMDNHQCFHNDTMCYRKA